MRYDNTVELDWLLSQQAYDQPPPRQLVVPLTARGVNLLRPDGSIFKYRCVTAFRGPELYALGEKTWLEDYYGWCLSLGANTVRWFCMWANTKYGPKARSDYYDKLFDAVEHAKGLGLYVHLVGFCDQDPSTSDIVLTHDEQDDHLYQCLDIARATESVLFEISNEDWKNGRIATAANYPSSVFDGLLAMRSSWADGEDPSLGGWLSLATKHCDRTFDWPRKGKVIHEMAFEGLGAYPPARVPSLSGEPQRIGEGTTPRQHADHAAVCELMGLGTCLHGGFSSFDSSHDNDLQNCKAPGPGPSLDAALAYRDVWTSSIFDPAVGGTEELVRGTERNDGECPTTHWDRFNEDSPWNHPEDGLNRSYYKLLDGKFYGLGVDPAPKWPGYETRNGWRIVAQGGYTGDGHGGNLLRLER